MARGNLPVEVTSFVGRREELSEARRLLGRTRLLTLAGVGGVGKTRLALQLANNVHRQFKDGVWLVELAPLREGQLLVQTVAAALGLTDRTVRPPVDSLVDFVADKELLLVLDNCEHLLDACAVLVERLLKAAAQVRVLTTSRQPLRVSGECVFDVAPLSVPDLALIEAGRGFEAFEAVRLFLDRAEAMLGSSGTEADPQAVARLCWRLDGIPLAIELAVGRLRGLSVEQILERLDDRFQLLTGGRRAALPRQQTLAATIEWSFELCSFKERMLWRRLSVFSGGFEFIAMEEVCCDEILSREGLYDVVANLVDKSILIRDADDARGRYRMLETIRQYGQNLLVELDEETTVRRRHRDYYQQASEQAEAEWFSPRQTQWLDWLQREDPNLRVALDFCMSEPGQAYAGLDLAAGLWPHWLYAGKPTEGRRWLDLGLTLEPQPSQARAKALCISGYFAVLQVDMDSGLPLLENSRDLARHFDDAALLGNIEHFRGIGAYVEGDFGHAVALLEQSLARQRQAGASPGWIWLNLINFAAAAILSGDARAQELCTEALESAETSGAQWCISWGFLVNGLAAWKTGYPRRATDLTRRAWREMLDINQRFQYQAAWCVDFLAWAATDDEQYDYGARLFGCARSLWRMNGSFLSEHEPLHATGASERCGALLREALGERAFTKAFQFGADLTYEEAIAFVLNEETPSPQRKSAMLKDSTALTRRERQVAELVAKGAANKEIAAALVISQRTAEHHVENIMIKCGFNSRTEIASWWTANYS